MGSHSSSNRPAPEKVPAFQLKVVGWSSFNQNDFRDENVYYARIHAVSDSVVLDFPTPQEKETGNYCTTRVVAVVPKNGLDLEIGPLQFFSAFYSTQVARTYRWLRNAIREMFPPLGVIEKFFAERPQDYLTPGMFDKRQNPELCLTEVIKGQKAVMKLTSAFQKHVLDEAKQLLDDLESGWGVVRYRRMKFGFRGADILQWNTRHDDVCFEVLAPHTVDVSGSWLDGLENPVFSEPFLKKLGDFIDKSEDEFLELQRSLGAYQEDYFIPVIKTLKEVIENNQRLAAGDYLSETMLQALDEKETADWIALPKKLTDLPKLIKHAICIRGRTLSVMWAQEVLDDNDSQCWWYRQFDFYETGYLRFCEAITQRFRMMKPKIPGLADASQHILQQIRKSWKDRGQAIRNFEEASDSESLHQSFRALLRATEDQILDLPKAVYGVELEHVVVSDNENSLKQGFLVYKLFLVLYLKHQDYAESEIMECLFTVKRWLEYSKLGQIDDKMQSNLQAYQELGEQAINSINASRKDKKEIRAIIVAINEKYPCLRKDVQEFIHSEYFRIYLAEKCLYCDKFAPTGSEVDPTSLGCDKCGVFPSDPTNPEGKLFPSHIGNDDRQVFDEH